MVHLEKGADFRCENHGPYFLLRPLTETARAWITTHLPNEARWLDKGVIVEQRRIWAILADIQESDLVIR